MHRGTHGQGLLFSQIEGEACTVGFYFDELVTTEIFLLYHPPFDAVGSKPVQDAMLRPEENDHLIACAELLSLRLRYPQGADRGLHNGQLPFPFRQPAADDVCLAEESTDEQISRSIVDPFRCVDLLDMTVPHHRNAVSEHQSLLLIVGDVQRCNGQLSLDAVDFLTQVLPQLGVQGAQGFIEQEQMRPGGQGSGQCHPLLLPPGQPGHLPLPIPLQGHQPEQLLDPFLRIFGAPALHARAETDIVPHIEMGEQGVVLENDTDASPVGGESVDPATVHVQGARIRINEAGNQPQGRGLAAAGGTQQGKKLALTHLEVQLQSEIRVDLLDVLYAQAHDQTSPPARSMIRNAKKQNSISTEPMAQAPMKL